MVWTNPRTWVSGETVTAALLNTHLRDNLKALGDPWTAYTPTWTAATSNPTLGNGTITGSYIQTGKMVDFKIRLVLGSTSTVGTGRYIWSLPVTALTTGDEVAGFALYLDTSAGTRYGRIASLATSTTVSIYAADGTGGASSASSPVVPANGDTYTIGGTYEAA